MYLKSVTIKNFRSIKEMSLNLNPGINLLVGDNGVGKTTILEAIVVGLGSCFKDISVANATNIKLEDVRQELCIVDGSPLKKYHKPVVIDCTMSVQDTDYSWSRIRKNEAPKAGTTNVFYGGDISVSDYFRDISNELNELLPVLNYQSINRVASLRKISDFGTSLKKIDDRRCGYTGCFDNSLDDKFIRKWCYAMERKNPPNRRYELFRSIVANTMKELSDLKEAPYLSYSEEFEDFIYSENNNPMPISYLSAGYQSILWLIMDIAFRTMLLNPQIETMEQAEGIVLIDEIDSHLHPKWQWNILNALKVNFPNIQFLITTHAPIVISSCKEGNIIRIEDYQEVQYLKNAYGYTTDEVLVSKQSSAGIPQRLRDLKAKFDSEISDSQFDLAKQTYNEMEKEFSEENSIVRKAFVTLSIVLDEDEF